MLKLRWYHPVSEKPREINLPLDDPEYRTMLIELRDALRAVDVDADVYVIEEAERAI